MTKRQFALGAVVASVAVGGVAARVLECRVLKRVQATTIAGVCECSLRTLGVYAFVAMLARLRGTRRMLSRPARAVRAAVHARVALETFAFALIPTEAYRRVLIERMWMSTILQVDGVIDRDLPVSRGTPEQFFDYLTSLVGGFGDREVMERPVMVEVVSWLYVILACRKVLGLDSMETMQEMWADYSPDAVRTLAGEPVTDSETLARAHRCFVTIYVLAGRILGLDEERARLGAELETPTRTAADTLHDVLDDGRAGRLGWSREQLGRRGISAEQLLAHSSSWKTLALVDGLAELCMEEARTQRRLLEATVLPRLRTEVIPHIRAPRWRRSRWLAQLKHRIDFLERYERQWQRRAEAARAARVGGSDGG